LNHAGNDLGTPVESDQQAVGMSWNSGRKRTATPFNPGQHFHGWSLDCGEGSRVECFAVAGLGQDGSVCLSAHAVSLEFDAVSVVDDPDEDGVCDGGFANHLVPSRRRPANPRPFAG